MAKKLTPQEGQILLKIARKAIKNHLNKEVVPPLNMNEYPYSLTKKGACFVTLTLHGVLRGCVGTIEASQPLIIDVQDRAIGAAFNDPRFPELKLEEYPDLKIEVSRLTAPEKLQYTTHNDLVNKLRPGIDGVILRKNFRRATFLPQVWEGLPDPEQFLGRLCMKMGLAPTAWRDQHLDVEIYQAEKFIEEIK